VLRRAAGGGLRRIKPLAAPERARGRVQGGGRVPPPCKPHDPRRGKTPPAQGKTLCRKRCLTRRRGGKIKDSRKGRKGRKEWQRRRQPQRHGGTEDTECVRVSSLPLPECFERSEKCIEGKQPRRQSMRNLPGEAPLPRYGLRPTRQAIAPVRGAWGCMSPE